MVEENKSIFVSYRREDTTAYAGWLADMLEDHFGERNVFRDIDSIEPGFDFVEAMERALATCEVMLVVIGRNWAPQLMEHERTGQEDYTRLEVATALKRNVRVIPVLVQGAPMPRADELPHDLVALTRRNAIALHDTNWNSDVHNLIARLERVLPAGVQEQFQTETVQPPKAVPTPDGGQIFIVNSLEEIEYLCRKGKVLVITTRAEKGWVTWVGLGESNALRRVRNIIAPSLAPTAKAEGVILCFSNVGGILDPNGLARFLSERNLRHFGDSFLLFEKGRLIRHRKPGRTEDAITVAKEVLKG